MDALTVTRAQPGDPGVRAILQTHHDLMRASSPEESCHALDVDSLLEAGATLLVARDGEEVLGVGALAPLCDGEGDERIIFYGFKKNGSSLKWLF